MLVQSSDSTAGFSSQQDTHCVLVAGRATVGAGSRRMLVSRMENMVSKTA